jgi:hypothetical protein
MARWLLRDLRSRLPRTGSLVSCLCWPAAVFLAACGSDSASSRPGSMVGGSSGAPALAGSGGTTEGGGAGAGGNSGSSAAPPVIVGGSGGSGGVGNGMQEVCDGLDNDADGIIDDVDVGGDGVCDCLNIATLGQIGPYSSGGNLFVTWLNERSPQGAVTLDDQVLTAELLAPFHIIVVLHVDTKAASSTNLTAAAHHAFSEEEAGVFKAWVEQGGGAMTTIGYSSDEAAEVVNVNHLLAGVGMGYSATRLDLNGYVESFEPHPVTDGVSRILIDNGVEPQGHGTVLARGEGDRVALDVAEVGAGRVIVWGDEWITYDSEWADVEDQQVELFWLNILKWLSPPHECQVEIPTPVK